MNLSRMTHAIKRYEVILFVAIAIVALVWLGMVLGVSFLATPVKFLAPTLSLPVALDVGRHTFHVFVQIEALFCLGSALLAFVLIRKWVGNALAAGLCIVVGFEYFWLLPALDERVAMIFAGHMPPASKLHQIYIALESIKVSVLLTLALWALHMALCVNRQAVPRHTHTSPLRPRGARMSGADMTGRQREG